MNENYKHDDFESFLRDSADGLRMRPSEKVWEGIAANLKERRRWGGFATGAFLLLTSVLGYFLFNGSGKLTLPIALAEAAVQGARELVPTDEMVTGGPSQTVIRHLSALSKQEEQTSLVKDKPLSAAIIRRLNRSKTLVPDPVVQKEAAVVAQDNEFSPSVIDSDPSAEALPTTAIENPKEKESLLTIESVTNLFRKTKEKSLTVQFFFSPTVSYRKLSENKSYMRAVPVTSAAPNYAVLYNINDVVTHKPDIGLELGMAAKYPLARNIQLRGGVQFNMNRYDIKAFNNTTELATITLNNGSSNVNVGARSNYRNFNNSGQSDWLQNLSFQVSAPVGAEIKLAGNEGTSFGVASTIQPTYVLGDRAYLLSTDYKNYTEVPWLMRKWNVATSLETFVAYSTGKMKWQVGPQVRYQLLSSFSTKYPVKENLFDFGLKIGISLNEKDGKEPK